MGFFKTFAAPLIFLLVGMVIGSTFYAYAPQIMRSADNEPPANLIVVRDRLHTSGQPSPAQLGGLKDSGYTLVINLAPPEVLGSVGEEGGLVGETGLDYLNIPVDWHYPTQDDFDLFSLVLQHASEQKVLVHCQVNMRASLFTFLYRVIYENADPDEAWENVIAIWVPDPHWMEFTDAVLARNGLTFEP